MLNAGEDATNVTPIARCQALGVTVTCLKISFRKSRLTLGLHSSINTFKEIQMSEIPLIQSEPDAEEVQEALERAENLLEEVIHYRKVATDIKERFERANEDKKHLSLDDLPYGEELIRTRDLPSSIEKAIDLLTKIETGKIPLANSLQAFWEAGGIIEEARNTLDDCTSLPPDED